MTKSLYSAALLLFSLASCMAKQEKHEMTSTRFIYKFAATPELYCPDADFSAQARRIADKMTKEIQSVLVNPSYELTLEGVDNNMKRTFTSDWKDTRSFAIPTGSYNVSGGSAPLPGSISDKAQLSVDGTIKVTGKSPSITLSARLKSPLLLLSQSDVEEAELWKDGHSSTLYRTDSYKYAFLLGKPDSLVWFTSKGAYVADLKGTEFKDGTIYVYNELSSDFDAREYTAAVKTVFPVLSPGSTPSPCYTSTINGRPALLQEIGGPTPDEKLELLNFSCSGTQILSITASEPIRTCSIHPLSRNVQPRITGNTLSFDIAGPAKYYICVNSLPPIACIANPLESDVPDPEDASVLYFGPGDHMAGEIPVRSGSKVYLAPGANVVGTITGSGRDIRIYGRGILKGTIRLQNCDRLTVEGITVSNPTGGSSNLVVSSTDVVYDNVKAFSHTERWGNDGINPMCCRGMRITDCFIRTKDDCISIKAKIPTDGNYNTNNITVEKCVLIGWSNSDGVTLGYELNGDEVKDIVLRDLDIICSHGSGRTQGHSAFSIVCDGNSNVHDILFEDIRVEDDIEYKNLEIILTDATLYGDGRIGYLHDITLKDIQWTNTLKPLVLAGQADRHIYGIKFINCKVGDKKLTSTSDANFDIRYADDISFE